MNDTVLMILVVGTLLLFCVMIGGGIFMVRASNANYRKRLALVTGAAQRERRQRGGKDTSGARRRQIQGKIKELEDQRKQTVRKRALADLAAAGRLEPQRQTVLSHQRGISPWS